MVPIRASLCAKEIEGSAMMINGQNAELSLLSMLLELIEPLITVVQTDSLWVSSPQKGAHCDWMPRYTDGAEIAQGSPGDCAGIVRR